jgi:DNA-binding XRE family transcriptional regulator
VLGGRSEVLVALDWTEFDDDDHATICAYVVTTHGRATPLIWRTVKKSELEGQRTAHEHALIERLHDAIPTKVGVHLLADRGFGDQVLYATLATLGWGYTIHFRGCILVEHKGEQRPASEWLLPTGRAQKLEGARVTDDRTEVGAVVVVHDKKMKEPWILATSARNEAATTIVKRYGRRFTIEETFRDQKDLRFGFGLRATHIRSTARETISRIETGSKTASLDLLVEVAAALELELHELFRIHDRNDAKDEVIDRLLLFALRLSTAEVELVLNVGSSVVAHARRVRTK